MVLPLPTEQCLPGVSREVAGNQGTLFYPEYLSTKKIAGDGDDYQVQEEDDDEKIELLLNDSAENLLQDTP